MPAKTIYISNTKLNGEKVKAIPLKSGTRQSCALSITILYRKQPKETKGTQIEKDEVQASLFADDMAVYINDPQNSTRELLQLIYTVSEMA